MDSRRNTSLSGAEATTDTSDALRAWVQRHKPLMDVFLDAFCVVDAENRVVDFNVAFTELCGESYRKILKIGDFCELVRTELCPGNCPGKRIITEARPLRIDELAGGTKAYPTLQLILGGVPIFDDAGKAIGALLTIRNVSAESELQKKYDQRKQESIIDGLTRLYNKVYTEAMLLRMTKSLSRDLEHLTVVMCDIDHFKKVNDTYGHRAGDFVLATVAQMLQGESRETDIVGRFGGEEFMLILGNSDPNGAQTFAERFRKRVQAAEIVFEGTRIPVTVSMGTASLSAKTVNNSPEALVRDAVSRADAALYWAKANGRNQVVVAEMMSTDDSGKAHSAK